MEAHRWGMLAVLVLARTSTGYVFQSIGSSGPAIAAAFAVDFLLIGTLIGLFKLPGIVLSLPSGLIGRVASDRMLIGVSLAIMGVGCLITAAAANYNLAAVGRLVTGVGATAANLYFTKAAIDWFAGSRFLPLAMAFLVNSWPLGIAAGLMTQGAMTVAFGWETSLFVAGASGLVAGALVLVVYRDRSGASPDGASTGMGLLWSLSRQEWIAASLLAFIWAVLNLGLALVFGFSPALLVGLGYDLAEAGWLISLGTWVGIAAIPLGGALVVRLGGTSLFVLVCTLASAMVFVLMTWWPAAPLLYVAFGIVAFAAAGPIMSMPAHYLAPENRPAGMGLFFTVYYVIMTIVPSAAGAARDAAGATAPLLIAAGLMLASAVAQAVLPKLAAGVRPKA